MDYAEEMMNALSFAQGPCYLTIFDHFRAEPLLLSLQQ